MELDAPEFAPLWEEAEREAALNVRLKGFRPGGAPLELARKAMNPEHVLEESVRHAVRRALDEAIETHQFTVLGQPKVEVLEASPRTPDAKGGLRCKVMFAVFPEVKLPDYKAIAKRVIEKEKVAVKVTGEEIEKTIEWIRSSRAKVTLVNRPAAKGDLVEADIESVVGGAPVEGGTLTGDRFILGESRFVPGFDEHLFGATRGKKEMFTLRAPENYWNERIRGKDVDFTVTVKGVFERELPALDDEFVKGLGPNFQGMASLRANIEQGIMIERTDRERERLRAKILEQIVKETKADPPTIMLERTVDSFLQETKELAGVKKEAVNEENLRKELAPKAKERLLANLAVHKILEVEGLEPTEAEVRAEAEALRLDPATHYDYAYGVIRHRKLFEYLEKSDK